MEGEDLVSPLEEGFDQPVELDERGVLPDVDEGGERLVGFLGVCCEVDAVEVLEHPPGCFQFGTAGQDPSERFDPFVGELIEAGELQKPGSEHIRLVGGSAAVGADALDPPTNFDHPCCEPSGDVEPVEDVGCMTQMGADGRPVRPGPVRDHHSHTLQPSVPLGHEEPREGSLVAVCDDPQRLAGVTVDQHRHIPMTAAETGLIDEKDPAAAPATLSCDPI